MTTIDADTINKLREAYGAHIPWYEPGDPDVLRLIDAYIWVAEQRQMLDDVYQELHDQHVELVMEHEMFKARLRELGYET